MKILTPFVLPIGVFDASVFIPYIRNLFGQQKNKFGEVHPAFKTTLGSYSYGSGNINNLCDDVGLDLRNFIQNSAKEFSSTLGYNTQIYEFVLENFWLNDMRSGSVHPNHAHYGKNYSGCIYVDMPEGAPGITFISPNSRWDKAGVEILQYTDCNSSTFTYAPNVGEMVIWESWITHGVEPVEPIHYYGNRRSAALDIVLKTLNNNS